MKKDYISPEHEIIYVSTDIITGSSPQNFDENGEYDFGDIDA